MKFNHLFVLGFLIHVIFLLSIFDIYFKSPIIHGIEAQENNVNLSTSRVVFISVDGLRFDALFENDPETGKILTPYIRDVIERRGTFGLSQTHVPTESRPGHVAMLAGFYEDPSAVTKGWKKNPVDFDSVFNQSKCCFSWGSPDILNVFYEGLNHSCSHAEAYEEDTQQFAGNTAQLDNWVFEKLELFLNNLNPKFKHKTGVLFFLHLLATDTSGHTDKPHSSKYNENLKNVDRLVKEIEDLFVKVFPDERTSFVLTSDHGMTDWGSHGAGDPAETDVPILAWGANIKTQSTMVHVSQADITPLVSILLGTPIPVNSVGVLPKGFLNTADENLAKAMLVNARQMVAQLETLAKSIEEQSLPFLYSPYGKLTSDELQVMMSSISQDIEKFRAVDAILKCQVLISLSLEGIQYYHNYYMGALLFCIASSHIAWIILLFIMLLSDSTSSFFNQNLISNVFITLIFVVTIALIKIQNLPTLYYFYFLLPELLWYLVLDRNKVIFNAIQRYGNSNILIFVVIIAIGVEFLVISFFKRWSLSIPILFVIVWPILTKKINNISLHVKCCWFVSGLLLAVFSMLPVIGKTPQVPFIVIGGSCVFLFALCSCFCFIKQNLKVSLLRCMSIAMAAWNSGSVHAGFAQARELPLLNQITSWVLLGLAFLQLLIGPKDMFSRLQCVFISLSIPFLLMTISHEGLFLVSLFVNLSCWVQVEAKVQTNRLFLPRTSPVQLNDFQQAFFFISYISIAFFGIGNIASLNSFDPAWVRCFLTVFSPFLMSFFVLFKTIIPFISVTCTLKALCHMIGVKSDRIFTIVLMFCNVMGLHFLFLVTNKGSWLEIGTSISHYVIQQVTVLFIVILYAISHKLMSVQETMFYDMCRTKHHVP